MSTTYIQPLTSVRGRMTYTELGEGRMYRENLTNGTDRIVAQFGDADSREEFVMYCEEVCFRNPGRSNEGFEVRVSWDRDELNPDNPDDVQKALEHTYKLCKAIAPESLCWLTAHTDGEGGCVHVHAVICNNDETNGSALYHGMTHWHVERENDRISIDEGLSVIGQSAVLKEAGQKDLWSVRRDFCTSFEKVLGDKVTLVRDGSSSVEEFVERLEAEGIELRKKKNRWTYVMYDPFSGRRRRREASRLADDLTKESVERLFSEKGTQQEIQGAAEEAPNLTAFGLTSIDLTGEAKARGPVLSEDDCWPSVEDVYAMVGDLKEVRRRRLIGEGRHMDDPLYKELTKVSGDAGDVLDDLRSEVSNARKRFLQSKEARDAAKSPCPFLTSLMFIYRGVGQSGGSYITKLLADMMMQMFRFIAEQKLKEKREETERMLFANRRLMWDAEKRLRAAEKALETVSGRTPGRETRKVPESFKTIYDQAVSVGVRESSTTAER